MNLSIVIPVFNEAELLLRTLKSVSGWCRSNTLWHEIIVVDDGSSDATLDNAQAFGHNHPHVKVISCVHRGKGAAVRTGVLRSKGRGVLFMDADGSTPIEELEPLVKKMAEGFPIVIGSRNLPGTEKEVTYATHARRAASRVFAFLARVISGVKVRDFQCGFKLFEGEAARKIFASQRIEGFAFDVELLYLAKKFTMPVAEVAVRWDAGERNRFSVVRAGCRMLMDTVRIRLIH